MSVNWRTSWRIGLVVALPLFLSACVPVFTLASAAASGVSYVITGKTVPDNTLSALSQQDCRMFRALQGDDVCLEQPAEAETAILPAATPVSDTKMRVTEGLQ